MTAATGTGLFDSEGFVLAGGQSRRMGRDKALVAFNGCLLIEQAVGILREAGLAVRIAGARSLLDSFAPVVEDSRPGSGPLAGICASLEAMTARWAAFLPVDLPLIPASLVGFMVRHAETSEHVVTVPAVNGFAQTFPAVVDSRALPALRRELDAGRGGCFAGFQVAAASIAGRVMVIPVEPAVQAGHLHHHSGLSPGRWFSNVNSERDLSRAEAGSYRVI